MEILTNEMILRNLLQNTMTGEVDEVEMGQDWP